MGGVAPCGRAPPSPPCSPRYHPRWAGESPSVFRAREKGLSRTVPRTASSRELHPHPPPLYPIRAVTVPLGVLFLNFPIIPEQSRENEMSEPGPSLFMGLVENVTDVHAGTPCISTGRGLLMRKDRTFMMRPTPAQTVKTFPEMKPMSVCAGPVTTDPWDFARHSLRTRGSSISTTHWSPLVPETWTVEPTAPPRTGPQAARDAALSPSPASAEAFTLHSSGIREGPELLTDLEPGL